MPLVSVVRVWRRQVMYEKAYKQPMRTTQSTPWPHLAHYLCVITAPSIC